MAVEIVAMLGATFAHAAVGQLTYVPAPDARRIDFKLILKPCFSTRLFMIPSAAGERQMLPRQINNTVCLPFFVMLLTFLFAKLA